jgi:hypothetical protein
MRRGQPTLEALLEARERAVIPAAHPRREQRREQPQQASRLRGHHQLHASAARLGGELPPARRLHAAAGRTHRRTVPSQRLVGLKARPLEGAFRVSARHRVAVLGSRLGLAVGHLPDRGEVIDVLGEVLGVGEIAEHLGGRTIDRDLGLDLHHSTGR